MKKSRLSDEKNAYALRQADSGTPVGDVCRQTGVSEDTIYVWNKNYGRRSVSELREIWHLRDENAHLKRLIADLAHRQDDLAELNELDRVRKQIQEHLAQARNAALYGFQCRAFEQVGRVDMLLVG